MTSPGRALSIGKARHLQRLMTQDGLFTIVAMDQRAILTQMLADCKGVEPASVPFQDMLAVKRLLVRALSRNASAMLLDPNIAIPAAIDILPAHTGLVVSLEDHRVEETAQGRKTASIPDWSVAKIQRLGADGVKVLIWYHPDADTDVCAHQQDYVRKVGEQCAAHEMPFILELLAYRPAAAAASLAGLGTANSLTDVVLRSVEEFAKPEYQVDLLKLESPVPVSALGPPGDAVTEAAFIAVGAACAKAGIPWVLLSAGVTTEQFLTVLSHAYVGGANGFLAGRAIWKAPLANFPDLDACRKSLESHGASALDQLVAYTNRHAQPCLPRQVSQNAVSAEGEFAGQY